MEIKFENFAEKEKVFIERTGKNFDLLQKVLSKTYLLHK